MINHATTCDCRQCMGALCFRVYDPGPALRLEHETSHYEAIGESRELARGQLPAPIVRQRVAVARDPRRVHLLRCMTRRPRLSLLERVRGMR